MDCKPANIGKQARDFAMTMTNRAKRLDCAVFSGAFCAGRMFSNFRPVPVRATAALKPPQSRRFARAGRLRQFPNQRVLASAGTDDEEFHEMTIRP